jgi:hypothetical protein
MLRSIQPRDHPLQAWMQSQFCELSLQLYGIKNFGCLFANWARVQTEFSAVMTSSYATWLEMYHCLEFAPLSPSQFLEVDIWGDPQATRDLVPLVANSTICEMLLNQGMRKVSQLWYYDTNWWKLSAVVLPGALLHYQMGCTRLIVSLSLPPPTCLARVPQFYSFSSEQGSFILTYLQETRLITFRVVSGLQNRLIPEVQTWPADLQLSRLHWQGSFLINLSLPYRKDSTTTPIMILCSPV